MNDTVQIVDKLWNYCNVLRDDGLSYGDYVEQLTYLLFLKMADEQTQPPCNRPSAIPAELRLAAACSSATATSWRSTTATSSRRSASETGMLGVIFRKAQNKIQDPAKLRRLIVDLIDGEQWTSLDADVKGDTYEGLLAKNAEDVKSGAGQYFTPRALIQAIVDVHAARAGRDDLRPGLRHRRLPAGRARLHRRAPPQLDRDQKQPPAATRRCTAGRSSTTPRGCAS